MRQILLLLALLALLPTWASSSRTELLVHFPSDESALDPQSTEALNELLAATVLDGDHSFTLRGHTDHEGNVRYNEALALARAQEVRRYLVEHGVDSAVIHIEAFGERDPLSRSSDDEGLAANRRVQVIFEQYRFADIDELRKELAEGTVQHFAIDPTKGQLLEGRNGTRVLIPGNTLVASDGSPVIGPVDITLTEAMGFDAMIAHNLSTHAGDRLLETAGMMNVEANDASGRELTLAKGSTVQVAVPKNTDQPGMQLFTSADGSDWTAAGQQPITAPTASKWEFYSFMHPAEPMRTFPDLQFPRYRESQVGKPHQPVDPVFPKAPVPPREESYRAQTHWWQFLSHASIERAAHERYVRALRAHEERIVRYEKKVRQYEVDRAAMPERIAQFKEHAVSWIAQKKQEHDAWCREQYAPIRAIYDSTYASRMAAYNEAMAEYWAKYHQHYNAWRDERNKCLEEYALLAERNGTADIGGLNAYVFNAAQLGWINCDRFYEVPQEQKYVAEVVDKDRAREMVYLVFSDIRSIVSMVRDEAGTYYYGGVPKTQQVELLAFTVKDGRPMLCRRPMKPGAPQALVYERSSFAEIKKLLRDMAGYAS
jgi:OmpA family